ncbi:MAG: glycogen synthase, partial [Clostridiales bacterium]|nr:glycogen synthase [Clostridiales bacterium]
MNVLFIGSEAMPFAKSGGLGDVLGALPKALKKEGVSSAVMLPLYKLAKEQYFDRMEKVAEFETSLSWRKKYAGVYKLNHDGVDYYFIDNQEYFMRDAYYGYFDDGERFSYFCKAALDSLKFIDFEPDILHVSEWQTALVPVYLKSYYGGWPEYDRLRTVFTIHNIEYKGEFDLRILTDLFGIGEKFTGLLEYKGCINLMKAAVVACDRLTTVSPSYAEEIQYEFYGRGLDNIVKENSYKFSGILNGIDEKLYNPKTDKQIFAKYNLKSIDDKKKNKAGLQNSLGLEEREDVKIVAMITRLAYHKGIDLVIRCFDELMHENIQF